MILLAFVYRIHLSGYPALTFRLLGIVFLAYAGLVVALVIYQVFFGMYD